MARHHVVIEVGKAHYDVDVMGFVRRGQPSTTDGGRTGTVPRDGGPERNENLRW